MTTGRSVAIGESEGPARQPRPSYGPAHDESADLVVIFDGEGTWTYDLESGRLEPHSQPSEH